MADDEVARLRERCMGLVEENRRLAQRCLDLEKTSRRQLERLRAANSVLARGEADLRVLLENSAIGFALIDLNLRIASANKALAAIVGQEQGDLLGVNFGNFIYVGKLPAFSRLTSRYVGRSNADDVIEVVARDGSLLPCRMAVSDWLDETGTLQGHFLLVFNAGPEAVAASRLKEMEEDMAEVETSRDLFIEVISRELRSPVGGIAGMSRMLMDSGLDERKKELAAVIHSSATTLSRLVDDLVDVVRIDTGEAKPTEEAFSPSGLARGAANLFAVRVEEKGLEVRVDIGANVPDQVLADPSLLRRVLVHLIDNSVKFTESGRITLSVDQLGDRLRFMVTDTGCGMTTDAAREFHASDPVSGTPLSRRLGGIGVGLALCRRLVTLMGGRLAYESTPGAGSEFHFTIPLRPAGPETVDTLMLPPVEALHLPPMSILLADANPLSLNTIRAYLRFDGHSITVAESGMEVAERCLDGSYDLAILDSNLPQLDGLQTLRLVRENEKTHARKSLPILLLVAPGQKIETRVHLRSGATGILKKPVQPAELMEAAAAVTGVEPLQVSRLGGPSAYNARTEGSSIRRLDSAQLVNLRQITPSDQFFGLMHFFLEDAVPELVELAKSISGGIRDSGRTSLAISKLKGLAEYLGFVDLGRILHEIHRLLQTGSPPEISGTLGDELTTVIDDSLEELKRILPEAFTTLSSGHGGPTQKM